MPLADEDVQQLYALPREEFLPARQQLVKRLREEDDREAATAAGTLRKPTVAAWAVNQLARQRREEIDDLIEVGRTVGRLQRKGPRSQDELRDATRERRRTIDALTQAAEEMLTAAGYGATRATLDAVAGTLEAAVRDESAREQVLRGALDKELEPPVGFGDLSTLRLVPAEEPEEPAPEASAAKPSRKGSGESAPDAAEDARRARARARAEQLASTAEGLEDEAARRRQEAADRVRVAVKARDAANRAEREAQQAEKEADLARKAAEKAERKAIEARERADRTAQEAGA